MEGYPVPLSKLTDNKTVVTWKVLANNNSQQKGYDLRFLHKTQYAFD